MTQLNDTVYYQNPPPFKNPPGKILYLRYLYINFKNFLNFFCLFFNITITPNPYPRLVSGSQI